MNIQEIKDKVAKELGRDPLSDPKSWDLIEKHLPKSMWPQFCSRSGAATFQSLKDEWPPQRILDEKRKRRQASYSSLQGRSGPQDSNDPHASELLAQFQAERERQAAVKSKKKTDPPKKPKKKAGPKAIKTK